MTSVLSIDRIAAPDVTALLKARPAADESGDDFARHLEEQGREVPPQRDPPPAQTRREVSERRPLRDARERDQPPQRSGAGETIEPVADDPVQQSAARETAGGETDANVAGDERTDAAPPAGSDGGAEAPQPETTAVAATAAPVPAMRPGLPAASTESPAVPGAAGGAPAPDTTDRPGVPRAPLDGTAIAGTDGDGLLSTRDVARPAPHVLPVQATPVQRSDTGADLALTPVNPATVAARENPATRAELPAVAAARRPETAGTQAQTAKPVPAFAEALGLQLSADGARVLPNGQIHQTAAPNQPGQTFVREGVSIERVPFEVVQAAKAGVREIGIRLDPPELGRIDVTLDVDEAGKVTTRLVVERSETLDQLRRDAPALERVLNEAGLKTDQNSLQFSLRGEGRQQQQDDGQRGRARRGVVAIDTAEINSWRSPPPDTAAARLRGGVDLRI